MCQQLRLSRPVQEQHLRAFCAGVGAAGGRAALRCGVRIAEVVNLLMADLFREQPFRRPWTHDKGSPKPGVDLSPQAERAPRARRGKRMAAGSEYVSLVFLYEGPSTTMIHERPMCVRNQAGLILMAHRFRHSVAKNLVHADVCTTSIQKRLGHRWIESTQTYITANGPQVCADTYAACARIEGRV